MQWLYKYHVPESISKLGPYCMRYAFYQAYPTPPDVDAGANQENAHDGDVGRAAGGGDCPPFIYAFIPMNWEDDFKGRERTLESGANYRWQFLIQYPDGVDKEEGEKWFREEVVPYFTESEYVNRFVSSRVKFNHGAPSAKFDRCCELWFEGEEEWHKAAVEFSEKIKKPEWAQQDLFPYLRPSHNFASMFLGDMCTLDSFMQYRGYLTMR